MQKIGPGRSERTSGGGRRRAATGMYEFVHEELTHPVVERAVFSLFLGVRGKASARQV